MNYSKKLVRKLLAPVIMMLLLLGMSMTAQAALTAPKIVKISAGESSVTLTYSKVSGAKGYAVYLINPETGEKLMEAPINKNSMSKLKNKSKVKISGLTNGTMYAFKIAAVSGDEYSELSNMMKATPQVANPGAMVNARVSANASKSVTLSWTKLKKASGYIVYQKGSDGKYKELKRIEDGSATSVKISKLTNGKTYYFRVAAYRTVDDVTVIGSRSGVLKGKPSKVYAAAKKVHSYYYKVKVTETTTAKQVGGSGTLTVKKGTTLRIVSRKNGYTGTSYFYKDDTKYSIPSTALNYDSYSFITRSKAYSDAVATQFVNYKGYKSSTKWMIWINTYTQRLYIFQGSQYNWKLYKKTLCSTGVAGTFTSFSDGETKLRAETPLGSSTIRSKQPEWKFAWDQYAYWASRIKGGAIHSWLYYPDTMQKWALGKLGKPSSHGCVRVDIVEAKFIYDNIPVGTRVVVY